MKIKKQWEVSGWISGDDYDAGKPCDKTVLVMATDEEEADMKGDNAITKSCQECAVIISREVV